MLLHFQEQKMALAVQCYDLVDTHVQNLARNLDGLREELEVTSCLALQQLRDPTLVPAACRTPRTLSLMAWIMG